MVCYLTAMEVEMLADHVMDIRIFTCCNLLRQIGSASRAAASWPVCRAEEGTYVSTQVGAQAKHRSRMLAQVGTPPFDNAERADA